jgi:hypothetical protein
MRRQVRSLLPFGGGDKTLRFSGRSHKSSTGSLDKGERGSEDDLYRALGRIAANWSLIEIASGLLLMSLLGSNDDALARAVVAGQRVENVWETTESLLVTYGDDTVDELAEFKSWRRSANKYRRRRNEAIHSAWSLTSEQGGPAAWDLMSQRAKRGARADLFPGGVPELRELATDIAALEDRLIAVHASILTVMDRRESFRRESS